ncbi:hypothetical protein J2128_000216 [Methanomicrobium sp. W14]|nr:hypothetical protein [Methanomicrobium sp. W14]
MPDMNGTAGRPGGEMPPCDKSVIQPEMPSES